MITSHHHGCSGLEIHPGLHGSCHLALFLFFLLIVRNFCWSMILTICQTKYIFKTGENTRKRMGARSCPKHCTKHGFLQSSPKRTRDIKCILQVQTFPAASSSCHRQIPAATHQPVSTWPFTLTEANGELCSRS